MNLFTIIIVLCALGAGLTAGIFYAFSTFVMAALARLPPPEGIAAMNAINVTVINPWFMAVFMGTPLLCVAVAILAFLNWSTPGSATILIAAVLYVTGSFVVTMIFNVPLNDALAAVAPASPEGTTLWTRYLTDWTFWNHVRTTVPLLATALFIVGLLLQRNANA
jgi:uncharacterized membrane protein